MDASMIFKLYYIFLIIYAVCNVEVSSDCGYEQFECRTICIPKTQVCDGKRDCSYYETTDEPHQCACKDGVRIVCSNYVLCGSYDTICDGYLECGNGTSSSDENACDVSKVVDFTAEKSEFVQWFLDRRSNSTLNRWGHQVHRTAVALYIADKNFFSPENRTGEEIRYELSLHLLNLLNRRKSLKTELLALYVQAMVVACLNPRNFYGHDLVSDLRQRVNHSKNANPLAILVLCNAGADMTTDDEERLNTTFYSQHRPYWTDYQVMCTMALSCISSKTNVSVDTDALDEWVNTLSRSQQKRENNPRTTALIIQMLLGLDEYFIGEFDWNSAVKTIKESPFFQSSHFLDKYHLMPVLSNKSPVSIDVSHCSNLPYNTDVFTQLLPEDTITVYYSVWIERNVDFGRSWRLRVSPKSSFFDVLEKVQTLDSSHFVKYNLVSGKPYVRSVSGIEEDSETDHYWFTYEKTYGSAADPKPLEDSPKDIKTRDNQELILWYKNGVWNADGSGSSELP